MKRKILPILLLITLLASLCFGVTVGATEPHGLTVTKDGGATEGSDYIWVTKTDAPDELHIKTNGLTVSGTGVHERIVADAGVTSLTLDNVTIKGCDTAVTIADNGTCTLTLVGTSTFGVNKTTGFDGTVTPSDWTDGVNKGIACAGKLILSGTGSINFLCATGITTPCFNPQNSDSVYYKSAPETPSKNGQVFLGWFDNETAGTQKTEYSAGNTYFAHWATPTGLTYTAETNNTVTTYGTAVTDKKIGTVGYSYLDSPLTAEITTASHSGITIKVSGTDVIVSVTAAANAGTYNYKISNDKTSPLAEEKTGTFTVSPKALTATDVIVVYDTEKVFDGTEQTFAVTSVTIAGGVTPTYEVTLNKAKDVKYSGVNVTTYEMKITFTGNYTGYVMKEYKVTPLALTAADIKPIPNQTYSGKEIKPQIITTKGVLLIAEEDYTAVYLKNTNAGSATDIIIPKGNYSGDPINLPFNILVDAQLSGTVVSTISDIIYTGQPVSPTSFLVYVGGELLAPLADYTFSYANNVNVGRATVILNVDTTLNKTKIKGTWYAYFNIVKKTPTADDVDNIPDQIYTGKAVCPEIVVHNGDAVLSSKTDYVLFFENNTAVGKAKVTIAFTGNYTGNIVKEFNIVNKPTVNSIATISDVVYNGAAQTPDVSIKLGDTYLDSGTDYELAYQNNVNAGTAKVVVTFKGKYAGFVLEKTFTILPKTMTADAVTNIERQIYTGNAITPEVTVKDGALYLVRGMDYTVAYQNNTNIGQAKVVVTFTGNYSGTIEKAFSIYQHKYYLKDIAEQDYTGYPIEPRSISVYDNEYMLIKDIDYVVEKYLNNVDVGTATVVVQLIGLHSGLVEGQFMIAPRTVLTNDHVTVPASVVYTGTALTPAVVVTDGAFVLTENKDYTVSYADNVNVGTATVTVTLQGNYAGTLTKTFEVTQKPMTAAAICVLSDETYNGAAHTPAVTVTDGDKVLVAGVDYELSYIKNVNAGTAGAKVVFIGNYTGTAIRDFTIVPFPAELLDEVILTTEVYVADGTPCVPGVVVRRNGEVLSNGVDYDLTYVDNENPGIAHVTLTFKGNYKGEFSVNYTINAPSLISEYDEGEAPIVSMSRVGGFDPDVQLVSAAGTVGSWNKVTGVEQIVPAKTLCKLYEKVAGVYSISLQKNGVTVQPNEFDGDGSVAMLLLVPDAVLGKSFRLFHVHGENDVRELTLSETATIGTYTMAVSNYYVLVQADELSDFVFIYQPACYFHWIACGVAALYLLAFALLTFVIVKKKWPIYVAGGVCAAGAAAIAVFGHCMLDLYIACGVGFLVILGTLFTILSLFLPKKKDGEKAQKPAKPQKEKKPKKEKQPKKDKKAQAAAENAEAAEQTPAAESVAASVDPYDNDTAAGGATAETAEAAEAAAPEGDENADAGNEAGDGKKRHRRTKAEMEAARAEEAARLEEMAAQGIVPEEKEKRHRRTKAEMEAARAEEAARLEELAAQGIVPEEKEKRHRRTKAEMEAARAEEAARLEELAAQGIVPEEKEKRHRRTKAEMEAARAAEAAAANGEAAADDEPAENDVDVVEIDLGNADDNAPIAETIASADPVETVETVESAEPVEAAETVETAETADTETAADADSFDNA